MRDAHELAWLAGFWDGEGCTCTIRNYATPTFTLTQCGPQGRELCQRVLDITGLKGAVHGPYRTSKGSENPQYQVRIPGGERVKALLEMCRPWLSRTKIEQAERVIARWEAYRVEHDVGGWKNRPNCANGHPWSEENTYTGAPGSSRRGRTCRVCHREAERERRRRRKAAAESAEVVLGA